MLKKKLVCVFPFLGKKVIRNQKTPAKFNLKNLPCCKLKVIFKSPSKIVDHFHFKDLLPKELCSGLMAKQNTTFMSEQLNIWEFHI